jgi:cell division protein ZapA
MSDPNKVTVKIYGHEYIIAGGKPRDYIVKVADHVDTVMTDIADHTKGVSPSSLAVLTAVNITDELFAQKETIGERDKEKEQLEKDIAHYIQLWEEAKRNFLQYKEDARASVEQRDRIQEKLNEKAIENDRLMKAAAEKDRKLVSLASEKDGQIESLTLEKDKQIESLVAEKDSQIAELNERVEDLAERMKARKEGDASSSVHIRELEDKYKELEGNYFEIQMDNIRLKGELDRYQKLSE